MLKFVKMFLCRNSVCGVGRGAAKGQMGGNVRPVVGWVTAVRLETVCGFCVLSSVSSLLREKHFLREAQHSGRRSA